MNDRANLNSDLVPVPGDHGNVLLQGSVGGAGDQLAHLLTAADQGDAGVDGLIGHISTVGTFVKLKFHFDCLLYFNFNFSLKAD
ncbi:hypothetical protein SDC9_131082 [bioreactor metagenome]|uniref:Uncharacterized protein n=1 Tax=bioreactor metagenome TaxID=1076179 RepID=A0A645D5U8_9ZZZZ